MKGNAGAMATIHVEVLPDAAAIGRRAADVVATQLRSGDLRVLGVATGSSPSPLYEALHDLHLPGWRDVQVFALDEYVGLGADHPQSYRAVIEREVRVPLGLPPENVHVPDGDAADLEAACADYEQQLRGSGGVDLQILGIGATGHIGFNEPGSDFASRTRQVRLSERTRADNARFFSGVEEVPRCALTQGIATIAESRRHLLVARGRRKAQAVAAALEGEVSTACPASALQGFADVTVLLDEEAASGLTSVDRREPATPGAGPARR